MANEPITLSETAADGSEVEYDVTVAKAEDLTGDDKSFVEEVIDALFDGDGGDQEAVFADLDRDGKLDTAASDTDGDGVIDTAVSDMDGDGKIDAMGTDTDGDGKFDSIGADTDGDGVVDAVGTDSDGDGKLDSAEFDTDGDGEADVVMEDTDGDGQMENVTEYEGLPSEEELSSNSVEFTVGEDGFPIVEGTDAEPDPFEAGTVSDGYTDPGPYSATPDVGSDATAADTTAADAEAAAAAEQQTHADAAREAQTAADEFVEKGDYGAAADARETAETEAAAAGDSSMLGTADSTDLDNAAYHQQEAESYREQQQEHIAEGDYAAAREDAREAGYATGDADYLAGGADHTGQSDRDVDNLGNAVYEEANRDDAINDAEWYAAQGDAEGVDRNLDAAETYQGAADDYASRADATDMDHDDDPSSLVETGGTYDAGYGADHDASSFDAGAYDAGAYDAVDAGTYDAGGYDAGVDTSTTSYDTSTDV